MVTLLDSVGYTVALGGSAVKVFVEAVYAGVAGANYEFAMLD